MERAVATKSWHALLRGGGSQEEARSLLEEGVNIEELDCYAYTPLGIAAGMGNKAVFDLLFSAGANINCKYPSDRTLLHHAARHGWLDTVKILLNKEFEADQRDSGRNTPLMLAAWEGYVEVCELLINAGANVNANNRWKGNTPLHEVAIGASGVKSTELAQLLLRAGADCNLLNWNTESALYLLMKKNKIGAVRLCFEMGACVDEFYYEKLQELPFFKGVLLKDTKMCTDAIINKYNTRDLPALYELSAVSLPDYDRLCVQKGGWMAEEVEQSVSQEIKAKGHCDVLTARPMVLSILAIRSFIEAIKSRETMERLYSNHQQSSKKLRLN